MQFMYLSINQYYTGVNQGKYSTSDTKTVEFTLYLREK